MFIPINFEANDGRWATAGSAGMDTDARLTASRQSLEGIAHEQLDA
jgi:hypothetical protein